MEEEIMLEGECSDNESAAIDVDNAGKHARDVVLDVDYSLMNSMKKKFASTRGKLSFRHTTIFTVPEDIRNDDAAAYSPKVVSIGLLQEEKRSLDAYKWHYLDKVRSRSNNNFEMYTKEMADIVLKAVSCYAGFQETDFRELEGCPAEGMRELWHERYCVLRMLVDGSFIINLLLQQNMVGTDDPIYRDRWTLPRVGHDMLLLENQLPFFVLEKLWKLTGRERPALKTEVLQFFRYLLPEEHDLVPPETEDVHHLLHLIHLSLQPIPLMEVTLKPGPPCNISCYECPESPQHTIVPCAYLPTQIEPRLVPPPPPKTVPPATELQEAGVKFQRKKARSFLEVTFERGLMQMPRLTISDSTNSLFRNFIAFEQGFPLCGSHFTSYCIFMDSLINTPRDVEVLKQSGIIEHVLGSDEEVALLFNKLSRGITWDFKNSYLAKVFEDVNQHTQKRWPNWRAKLVRDYFSNPWTILSLIAAIVILFLTFLQTYFAVFAYFRPP